MEERIARLYEAESSRVLATLVRLLGDLEEAEEAMQEAFRAALLKWPLEGVPSNPVSWLISTGRFKGIDTYRRRRRSEELVHRELAPQGSSFTPPEWDGDVIKDDELRLVFTACHPDVPIEGRIALSLRVVCGLSTEEIARAFLVSAGTMKRRLTRAKTTIRERRIPYEVPPPDQLAARLAAVLRVIYLVYNEGYVATRGDDYIRQDLTATAVRMARRLSTLLSHPEVTGLLALLLFHESRAGVRADEEGRPVPLEAQDRSQWSGGLITEATRLVERGVRSGRLGPYLIQALVASVHAAAPSVEETNWELIVGYYDMLLSLEGSPVVALNRAIAVGMRDGPEAGLILVDEVLKTPGMDTYHPAHAARAEFARRDGRHREARESLERALAHVGSQPERTFLESRLEGLGDNADGV